jgi:hypothetical protein
MPAAGLGAALLAGQGMAAWVRGWRACAPPPAEVVGVLAAMALACT